MLTNIEVKTMSSLIAARLNNELVQQFEQAAKLRHQTKAQLLQDIIKRYLMQDRELATLIADAKRLAEHERLYPEDYADLYHSVMHLACQTTRVSS
jgi:predicted DNA-binding protein